MAEEFTYEISNWADGVVKSLDSDRLSAEAVLEAKNTQFWKTAGGQTIIGTRSGTRFVSATNLTDIRYMAPYNYPEGDGLQHTRYLAMIDASGALAYKKQDDTSTEILTPPSDFPYTGVCIPPQFVANIDSAVMNGRLFLVAGTQKRSMLGKSYVPFGLAVPQGVASKVSQQSTSIPTVRLPADEYDVYVTAYEPLTGAESDWALAGTIDTNLVPNQGPVVLRVDITALTVKSSTWRVYLQRRSTQAEAYLVTDPRNNTDELITTDGNIPIASTSVFVDLTAEEIADAIIALPLLGENAQLTTEISYLAVQNRRLIAASTRKIFWSRIDTPDAFPPQNCEVFATPDGGEITGLMTLEDEIILVTTTTGTYGIFGQDPQYWTVKPIDLNVGCVGKRSMVKFDGGVAWWSPQFGPVVYQNGQIVKIGMELLGRIEAPLGGGHQIISGWDPQSETIVWAYPNVGDVQNTTMVPFNYRVGKWCASQWDPMWIGALATGWNSANEQRLFLTDRRVSLFHFDSAVAWDGYGPSVGTVTGTLSASAGTLTFFASSGLYNVNGASNAGQTVSIVDSTGKLIARRFISTVAAGTDVYFDRAVTIPSNGTYTFYIGSPLFELTTGWLDMGDAFRKKRFDRVFVDMQQSFSTPVRVEVKLDRDDVTVAGTLSVSAGAGLAATLDATWDVPVVLTTPFVKKRLGVWKTGHVLQLSLTQLTPERVWVSRLVTTGRMLHERYFT
jgi:hypothetical protein